MKRYIYARLSTNVVNLAFFMFLTRFSITQKITLLGSAIALIVAALIGITSLFSAKPLLNSE